MRLFSTTRILWQTFGKYRWHVAALVVLGFLGAILEGIGINAVIPLVSFLTSSGTPTDIISRFIGFLFALAHIPFKFRYLLMFILGLFMLRAFSVVAFGYIRGWITADFFSAESQILLRRTLAASWPFLLKQKLGHVHTTMIRDMQRTSNLLEVMSQVIQSVTGFLMYLLVAVNLSVMLTISTFAAGMILVIAVRPFLNRTKQMGTEMAATEKNISQFLSEHIIGMKAVKVAGAEERALGQGTAFMRHLRGLQTRLALSRSLGTSLFQPFSLVLVVVLFAITYHSPGFSFISFAAAIYLIQKIFTYLESSQTALSGVLELVPYAENMISFKKVLEEHAEEKGGGTRPFSFEKELAFKNVSFAYAEEGKPVLSGVEFSVRRGEMIGLIGPSGAGKTSVADLVLRLFTPASGKVTLDGVPVEEISLGDWRAHIGYVAQDLFLFNGSIEENIRFYRPELSREAIHAAAKQANIYDFVMSLPEKFDSHIGDRGVMISGGQRQRIALARALAGKPDILVLDEATSALDSESERLIQEAIQRLHGEITVIIIAHRLSTVGNTDMLFVLDKGKIIEHGSPAELRADPTSYFSTHGGK